MVDCVTSYPRGSYRWLGTSLGAPENVTLFTCSKPSPTYCIPYSICTRLDTAEVLSAYYFTAAGDREELRTKRYKNVRILRCVSDAATIRLHSCTTLLLYAREKTEDSFVPTRPPLAAHFFPRQICEQVVALRTRVEMMLPSTCTIPPEREIRYVNKDTGIHQVCRHV